LPKFACFFLRHRVFPSHGDCVQIARHAHEDEYLEPDELEPVSAAVIHTSPTMRYHRAATVDLHVRVPPCLLLLSGYLSSTTTSPLTSRV